MMTFILIAAFFLIAFVALLRYDVHKHKYAKPEKINLTLQADQIRHLIHRVLPKINMMNQVTMAMVATKRIDV